MVHGLPIPLTYTTAENIYKDKIRRGKSVNSITKFPAKTIFWLWNSIKDNFQIKFENPFKK